MLEVQRYLRSGKSLDDLKAEFGIEHVVHNSEPLVIVNYHICDSKLKYHPIVKECRALTLEANTWQLVSKSFDRFYNLAEDIEGAKLFNWDGCSIQAKEDGSLIKLFFYGDRWRISTRGSFAEGVVNGSEYTWYSLFFPLIQNNLEYLSKEVTYVMEGVSPYNKIVTHYTEPALYLLAAFDNSTAEELPRDFVERQADDLEIKVPQYYDFKNQNEITTWLETVPHPTFEGFVCKDINNHRLKIKAKSYVNLHQLKNNNNIFLAKNLVPLILKGKIDEAMVYFPELGPMVEKTRTTLDTAYIEAKSAFDAAIHLTNQGDKARMLQSKTRLTAPCFTALKANRPFEDVWKEHSVYLIRHLFE